MDAPLGVMGNAVDPVVREASDHLVGDQGPRESPLWRPMARLHVSLQAFLASRLIVLAGTWAGLFLTRSRRGGSSGMFEALGAWDGAWYLSIAVGGYATELVTVAGEPTWTNIAFFPTFPFLVRAVGLALGLPALPAALLVAHVVGALSAWCVWLLARELTDEGAASRVVWLYCFFPGGVFLSMAYPEGLFVVSAALCLLALQREQWLLAGLAAAAGAATRSHGIALVACCAVAALRGIIRDRQWRSIVAPVLAPLGLLGFFLYLWTHTGDPLIWFQAMDTWTSHARLGAGLVQPVIALLRPLEFGPFTGVLGVACMAGLVYAWRMDVRHRVLPLPMWTYSASIVALVLLLTEMGPRPRYILLAFPLLIPVGVGLSPARFRWAMPRLGVVLALCSVMYTNGFGLVP